MIECWTRLPEPIRMWSPWWLRHVLAVERDSHNRTMQELREAEAASGGR
jgi:predicted alpha-1,6-mannanase (GH76 family)